MVTPNDRQGCGGISKYHESASSGVPRGHRSLVMCEPLVSLNGFEVFAQVLDALPDRRFVVVFLILEDRSPHGHLGRAMRGKSETEAQNVCHVLFRERSSVPLRESGEVRRSLSQRAGIQVHGLSPPSRGKPHSSLCTSACHGSEGKGHGPVRSEE